MVIRIIILFKFFWFKNQVLESLATLGLLQALVELGKLLFEFFYVIWLRV